MFTATFHTHFGATAFLRELNKKGKTARMAPVPRCLSASCGVCVIFYDKDGLDFSKYTDLDGVYLEENGGYTLIHKEE